VKQPRRGWDGHATAGGTPALLKKCNHSGSPLREDGSTKSEVESMAEPTYEELKARLAELEKQGGTRRTGSLEFRVGEKGGVSVYGLGRFPVTLYYEQWNRLLDASDKLREFLEENKSKLKLKDK
jgi:hypothetical protein